MWQSRHTQTSVPVVDHGEESFDVDDEDDDNDDDDDDDNNDNNNNNDDDDILTNNHHCHDIATMSRSTTLICH